MKTIVRAVVWGALLTGGLAAGPIYRINFTGTLTSGAAQDFNLIQNASETVADLTGLTISGWLDFNLGAAPVPVVSVDNSGFTNTVIQSIGGPIFVSEHVVIDGFTAPTAGFVPMPSTFELAPVPSLPSGTTVTQTQDSQNLQFSTKTALGPQSILSGMNLQNSWTGPQASGSDNISVNMLMASGLNGPHFFPVPPAGELPSTWGPALNIGGNGVFTFAELSQNPTNPDHFGITTDYSVSGQFTFDSVSGGFLATPEPSSLALAAAALMLAVARFRVRSPAGC